MDDKILVLGSSSWLGFLLLEKLSLQFPNTQLAGTVHKHKLDFAFKLKLYNATQIEEYKYALSDFKPSIIVNFLRGEDSGGQFIHRTMIDYSLATDAYYVYASSALALDGYENIDLTENLLAFSKSEYGSFKARCEEDLYNSSFKWSILRFSSVQGWVKHKITRNENLLIKLSKGEKIIVDKGVFQNRMSADLMIKGIAQLLKFKTEGIVHFGTTDSSDEFDFLRRQAELFGYSTKLIEESCHCRNVNLVCMPNRIFTILGESFMVLESDTLKSLIEMPNLKSYKL